MCFDFMLGNKPVNYNQAKNSLKYMTYVNIMAPTLNNNRS